MKITKNGIKIHQAVSSYDGFHITTRGQCSAVLNFLICVKNLYSHAIEISKISILIDFEVEDFKNEVVFGKLQR